MQHEGIHRLSKRATSTKLRRCLQAMFAMSLMLILSRNMIARSLATRIGSAMLDSRIEIGAVRIGLRNIAMDDITVVSQSGSSEPFLHVRRVNVVTTPWQGLCSGVWARRVVVDEPTVQLRFDAQGKLISTFPGAGGESGGGVIPLQQAIVTKARLVVHQLGRESLVVSDGELTANFGKSIRLTMVLPDALGGRIELHSLVDCRSLEGVSTLSAHDVKIDTHQLATMPLVPPSINGEEIAATASAFIRIRHPPNQPDPRLHSMRLRIALDRITSPREGVVCRHFDISASNNQGALRIASSGDLLNGSIALAADAMMLKTPLVANVSAELCGCELGDLVDSLVDGLGLTASADVDARARLQWQARTLAFDGQLSATAARLSVNGLPIAPVTADAHSTGSWSSDEPLALSGTLEGSVQSEGVSILDLADRFKIPTAHGNLIARGNTTARGNVRGSANFQVPLSQLANPDRYVVVADFSATDVGISEVSLDDAVARFRVGDGVATFEILDAIVRDANSTRIAELAASARTTLSRSGKIEASLGLAMLPTASTAKSIGVEGAELSGEIFAAAYASCDLLRVTEAEAWSASGEVKGRRLVVFDESIQDLTANWNLIGGQFALYEFPFRWRDTECKVGATGSITGGARINGTISAGPIQLRDLSDVVARFSTHRPPAAGIADFNGTFEVAAWPVTFNADGIARLSEASFAGTRIGNAELSCHADLASISVHTASDDFLGGRYAVTATAHELDWTRAAIRGQFHGVQASRLLAISGADQPSTGLLDGGIDLTSIANLQSLRGRAWIRSRRMSISKLPLEITSATVSLADGEASGAVSGTICDGRFDGSGRCELQQLGDFQRNPQRRLADLPITFQGKLTRLAVEGFVGSLTQRHDLAPLRGTVEATVVRDPGTIAAGLVCTATASVQKLRWNQSALSDRLTTVVRVKPDRLELQSIDGRFADGRVSGSADVSLTSPPQGRFDLVASRVNLRRAAAPLIAQDVSGNGSIRITGRIGGVMTGQANLSLDLATLAGVTVHQARLPVDWSYSQTSKVGRWRCRGGVIQLGGGKIRVASEGNFGTNLNMATTLQVQQVDSSKLIPGKSLGAGMIDGNVTLQAKHARSLNQVFGNIDLEFADVQAMEIPVLNQLSQIIRLSPTSSDRTNGGYLDGRLAGGLVYVDQLALSQSNIQVLMQGNSTLDGRMNFEVTASTQQSGPADQILAFANSPLMLAAPAPVALIAKANEAMKDRVVHVHIGGTAARPTLRLQPGKQLSQDTLKFFLKDSLGGQIVDVVQSQKRATRTR